MLTDTEVELNQILEETIGEYPFIMYKAEKLKSNIDEELFELSVYQNNKLVKIKIHKEDYRWYVNLDEDIYKIFSQYDAINLWKSISLALFQSK